MLLNDEFIKDPRSKQLNPTTKLAGHFMTAIIDYAKENDVSKMTLDDVFKMCNEMQKGSQ